jgi:hypothetical protein
MGLGMVGFQYFFRSLKIEAVLQGMDLLGIICGTSNWMSVTCLVLSDQFHLETLAPVINSFCHPATNSDGV